MIARFLQAKLFAVLFLSVLTAQAVEEKATNSSSTEIQKPSAKPKTNFLIAPPRRDVPGKRITLDRGSLYVPDFFKPASNRADLVLFFHGAAWCAEQNFYDARKNAVLVSISHTNYAEFFHDSHRFESILATVSNALAKGKVCDGGIGNICLASFSGGYVAVREILKQETNTARVTDVVLADSLYAPRAKGNTNELDSAAMEPFLNYARRAADGKGTFWFTQLFPPEEKYRNNTTTLAANYLIDALKAQRVPADSRNSQGAQALYRADKGNFHVIGYAGMTTQDHFNHFYALSDLLKEISFTSVKP